MGSSPTMDLSFGCFFLWINAIKLLPALIIFLREQIPELKTHSHTCYLLQKPWHCNWKILLKMLGNPRMFVGLYKRDLENIQGCSIYISALIRWAVEVLQNPAQHPHRKEQLFQSLSISPLLLYFKEESGRKASSLFQQVLKKCGKSLMF